MFVLDVDIDDGTNTFNLPRHRKFSFENYVLVGMMLSILGLTLSMLGVIPFR